MSPPPPDTGKPQDEALLLGLLALFVWVSPLKLWLTGSAAWWFLPFGGWLALIGIAWWIERRRRG